MLAVYTKYISSTEHRIAKIRVSSQGYKSKFFLYREMEKLVSDSNRIDEVHFQAIKEFIKIRMPMFGNADFVAANINQRSGYVFIPIFHGNIKTPIYKYEESK